MHRVFLGHLKTSFWTKRMGGVYGKAHVRVWAKLENWAISGPWMIIWFLGLLECEFGLSLGPS